MCKCYAPIPWESTAKDDDSERFYEFYLAQEHDELDSFLSFCRLYKIEHRQLKKYSAHGKDTMAVGSRFFSELKDNYISQVATMLMLDASRQQLQPTANALLALLVSIDLHRY